MKKIIVIIALSALSVSVARADNIPGPSHGIDYPVGWQNWKTVALSHRTDNSTIRVILGNDIAVTAARAGNTDPWPNGAILGKVVWKDKQHTSWEQAVAAGNFIHAEFMFRDNIRYKETHGWGWARWVGVEQQPFLEGASVCINCHTPVKDRNWVFTEPAVFPQAGLVNE